MTFQVNLMNIAFDSGRILNDMKNLWHGQVPHEGDFYFFRSICNIDKPITLLDCGANSGQSAISYLMNCPKGRVISFEPNVIYEQVLQGVHHLLGAERFEFHMEGLSDEDNDLELHIPYVDGIPYLQEATLDVSQFDKPWVIERLRSYGEVFIITKKIARFVVTDSRNLVADVVKIDAEGAEMRVLRGMQKTISKCEPIFLIENNDWQSVTDFLNMFGYKPYQFDVSSGLLVNMRGSSTNCFYLKGEHFDRYGLILPK